MSRFALSQQRVVCVGWLLILLTAATARADIFNWFNRQLIPGTEGITPGPGVVLDHHELAIAELSERDLTGARFDFSNLTYASLSSSTLTNADLTGANLTNAHLYFSTLTNANLSGAVVTGANFGLTTSRGFTQAQLASTASYQTKNLPGIGLGYNDLTGWNFSGQNLTYAQLDYSTLTNANLSGAVVTGANFGSTRGFTQAQLTSTASYQAKNLPGIKLGLNDLTGWDFTGQNLSKAFLDSSTLTNANLSGAVVTGAGFGGTTSRGFTKEQLYSTASYQGKDLHGIGLGNNDLTGWDFSGQNIEGANWSNANFTKEQLYSTASYQQKNLQGIGLSANDLSDWDFSGQNLTNANLDSSTLTNANLTGAVVTGANFERHYKGQDDGTGLSQAQLASTASYKSKNLQGINLWGNDLTGMDLSGQNLMGAIFDQQWDLPGRSNLTNANLSGANLTGSILSDTTLTNANLSRADARGANFYLDTLSGANTSNLIQSDGHIAGLNLAAGETLVAHAGVPIPVQVWGNFSVAATARFDLTDNAAIVDYIGPSPVATVREKILSGRGGPGLGATWTGTGITSSTAATVNQTAPDSRSLGYAENATLPLGAYTTFHGAPVDNTSILIAFTRTADANLDGVVNDNDVTIIGATYAPGLSQPSWALGDFDYNGFVDDDDVTLLGVFYDPSAAPVGVAARAEANLVAAVPEPTAVLLWAIGTLALAYCRVECRRRASGKAGAT